MDPIHLSPAANSNDPAVSLSLQGGALPQTAPGGELPPPPYNPPAREIRVHYGHEQMSTAAAMGIGAAIGIAVSAASVGLVVWWANRKASKEAAPGKPNLRAAA